MKQVTLPTHVIVVLPDLDLFVCFSNHGKLQNSPTVGMLQNCPEQIVVVGSLPDKDDCSIFVVIESR